MTKTIGIDELKKFRQIYEIIDYIAKQKENGASSESIYKSLNLKPEELTGLSIPLFSEDMIREPQRLNLIQIVEAALDEVVESNKLNELKNNHMDCDWETLFIDTAGNCSNDKLKRLCVSLLKNELIGIKTSKKTLHILKYLNLGDAELIHKALRYSLTFKMVETKGTELIDRGIIKSGVFPPHGSRLEKDYPFEIDYEDIGRLINLGIIESRETSKLRLSANQEYFAVASNKLLKFKADRELELPYITWSREGRDFFNIDYKMCEDAEVENYYYQQFERVEHLNIDLSIELQY